MKTLRILLVLILGLALSSVAMAGGNRGGYRGGGHHHNKGGTRWVVGVNVGLPGYWGGYWGGWPYWPAYYPYPYYPYSYPAYYPGPVVVQQQPTTYIEQPAPQAQQQQGPVGYWYYCADPGAYYPYVKECPAGWQRVAPQPSN